MAYMYEIYLKFVNHNLYNASIQYEAFTDCSSTELLFKSESTLGAVDILNKINQYTKIPAYKLDGTEFYFSNPEIYNNNCINESSDIVLVNKCLHRTSQYIDCCDDDTFEFVNADGDFIIATINAYTVSNTVN